ncbi:MAG: hypothetical protein SVK08_00450 [Halobacteriota archaeon]|nr:hypothetical protein [Halobacteriota archaeon]
MIEITPNKQSFARHREPRMRIIDFEIPSIDALSTSDYYAVPVPGFGMIKQVKVEVPAGEVHVSIGITDGFTPNTNEDAVRITNITGIFDDANIDAHYYTKDKPADQNEGFLYVLIENISDATGTIKMQIAIEDY